jgi:hypothetical protein
VLNEPGELRLEQFTKREENGQKSQGFKKTPLKPPGKNMPFAFITSRLPFPQLNSTLQSKFEAHDGAMLHKPIINCRRRIVNQTPDFLSPVTSKPASRGRIKTSHSEAWIS